MPAKVRLNKVLRDCLLGSRRKCEKLVSDGLVKIGGTQVTQMATLVDPVADVVEVAGKRVRPAEGRIFVAANKPRGVVVTASDPRGRQTIYERIRGLPRGTFCVGRLDMDSEGLILLTNDGKLAFRLAHPKSAIERVYEVEVAGKPDAETIRALAAGVVLEDGKAQATSVNLAGQSRDSFKLRLVLTEGRKREVRRMISACGMDLMRLRRVRFGSVGLGALPSGGWRLLTRDEVRGLRRLVGEAHEAALETRAARRKTQSTGGQKRVGNEDAKERARRARD